jgi:hypothetical protein
MITQVVAEVVGAAAQAEILLQLLPEQQELVCLFQKLEQHLPLVVLVDSTIKDLQKETVLLVLPKLVMGDKALREEVLGLALVATVGQAPFD